MGAAGVIGLVLNLRQGRAGLVKAREANEIARESAEKQLRAYVNVGTIYATGLADGERPTIHFTIKNVGQTPAHALRVVSGIFLAKDPHAETIEFQRVDPMRRFNLGQGGHFRLSHKFDEPKTVTAADVDNFLKGEWCIVVAGVISYRDAFGKLRRTVFRAHTIPAPMKDGKLALTPGRKHNRSN